MLAIGKADTHLVRMESIGIRLLKASHIMLIAIGSCASIFFLSSLVSAQQDDTVSELRRLIADLNVKIGSVERELRNTTGRLEEMEFKNRSLEDEVTLLRKELQLLASTQSEMSARLASGQPAVNTASNSGAAVSLPQAGEGDAVSAGAETSNPASNGLQLPVGSPAERFDFAFSFVRKNDLEGAQQLLSDFIAEHGGDPLTANAYFWLGRVYLQAGQPQSAAQNLLKLVDGFEGHEKRVEAFFYLAEALVKMDFKTEACDALYEFSRLEAQASPRLKTRAAALEQTAACQ